MRSMIPGGVGATAALILTVGRVAYAADATGVELGFRSGYALPFGHAVGAPNGQSTPQMSDAIKGAVPLWFDAGYRFNPNMLIGAFFQYGVGFVNTDKNPGCNNAGVSCSINDVMVGAQFHYHVMPDGTVDPWFGLGVGYEILNFSLSENGLTLSGNDNGFQFLNVQAGADFKPMPNLGIGPFVMFSLGEFSNCSASITGLPTPSCSIPNTDVHEWLTLGIRGAYDINVGR